MVHGAFAGAWIWEPLAEVLERAGHTVEAMDLPGSGDDRTPVAEVTLDAYAQRVCEALAERPERAVVVASSMGGVVATQAVARSPESVATIVYSAAFVPQHGQSLLDLTRLPEGAGDQTQVNLVVEGDPPVATLPDDVTRNLTMHACSDEVAAWAIERRRPQPVGPFAEPVDLAGYDFEGITRAYVLCKGDESIPPALQRRMLETTGCDPVFELDTDHVPHLSRTAALADLLDQLAQ